MVCGRELAQLGGEALRARDGRPKRSEDLISGDSVELEGAAAR
jgi:hypothetical protein